MWKEGTSPIISAAEWEIRKRLDLEGIHMEYQKFFILDAHNADVYGQWSSGTEHVFEVDGPIHLTSEKVKRRDEFLDQWFEKRHVNVWHLPYTPPLSQKRLEEIVEFIKSKGFIGRTR